jgi:hypothetical protein
MTKDESRRHPTLGTLWLLYGVLMLGAAAWIVVYNRTLTLMWGAIINHVADPLTWMTLFHVFLVATVVMALISGAFSFLAAFALLGPPPGVALGAFTAIALFPLRGQENSR